MLGTLTETPDQSGYQMVKSFWQSQYRSPDFEQAWEHWLHDGIIPNTAFPERQGIRYRPKRWPNPEVTPPKRV